LTETDESIGLVIDMSGLSSRSHFNALFREHYKMTPSEYRKISRITAMSKVAFSSFA